MAASEGTLSGSNVEGRLSLNVWTGKDGQQRMGLVGRGMAGTTARPDRKAEAKVQSRDEYERPRDEQDAVPFDDLLRF